MYSPSAECLLSSLRLRELQLLVDDQELVSGLGVYNVDLQVKCASLYGISSFLPLVQGYLM